MNDFDRLHPCQCAAALMFRFFDGDLDDETADELRHHVDACAACTDGYDVEVVYRETLQRCCREQAPASLRSRIVMLRIQRG